MVIYQSPVSHCTIESNDWTLLLIYICFRSASFCFAPVKTSKTVPDILSFVFVGLIYCWPNIKTFSVVPVGLIYCWTNKNYIIFLLVTWEKMLNFGVPLAEKNGPLNKQIICHAKKVAENIFMKPARKKAGLFAPPRLSIYIKSDRYPTKKKTRDKNGKKARQQICLSPPPPPPPPSTLSSSSHMWGVEDPLRKSKRRQRMEQIWAQNKSINSQGSGGGGKNLFSP